jgi:hypothetical protein
MAQVPNVAGQSRYTSGLYRLLTDREERAAAAGGVLSYPETGTSYSGHDHRLKALRVGRPVSLCVGDLPATARIGLDTGWRCRATVAPDGTMALYEDDGSEWLRENGL